MSDRATNKDGQAIVVNMAPDVCLTPMGGVMVPVPYNITSQFSIAVTTSNDVNYAGLPAFTMASRLPTVKGDEPGVGGGVVSGVNLGYCKPVQHSSTYRVNGEWVIRHGDEMDMNCAGPDGVGNTIGQIVYAGVGPVPALGDDDEDDEDDEEARRKAEEDLKNAEAELEAAKAEIAKLAIETGLDIAGILDPTPISDGIAAGMAWDRGDYIGMFGSMLGWVPWLGDAVGKPLKAWRSSVAATRLAEKFQKILAKLEKLKDVLKRFRPRKKAEAPGPKKPPGEGNGGHIPGGGAPANAQSTLSYVRQNGKAPPGFKGGKEFKNDGRGGGQVLPKTDKNGNPITYKEWDTNPYTQGVNRGPERIVTGSDGSAYYTGDHYGTFSPM